MLIRSILFYVCLTMWTILMGITCVPYLFASNVHMQKPVKLWIFGIFSLLKHLCKITYEIKGRENIPDYPLIIASKHQSAFETFALFYTIKNAVFIHKRQLFYIPIFGQYLKKLNMISINRKGKAMTMRKMIADTKTKISNGSSIIIFPEGTRKRPGEIPDYKTGFIGIYKATNAKILPVALNSGNFWPKHSFIKKKGHIIIQFLEVIPSNLDRSKVLNEIKNKIEIATNLII